MTQFPPGRLTSDNATLHRVVVNNRQEAAELLSQVPEASHVEVSGIASRIWKSINS